MPNPMVVVPGAPPFLAGVAKSAIKRLDPDQALFCATAETDAWPNAILAFHSIERLLGAAERQYRRIERARRTLAKDRTPSVHRGTVFDDIHFLMICWSRIAKFTEVLRRSTRFSRVGLVRKRYRRDLEGMVEARDHLEHFEARLPGGKKREKMRAAPGDLLNLVGDKLSFGGKRYDVGRGSRVVLRDFGRELRDAVLYDSLEALAASDPDQLARLVQNAVTDVHIGKALREYRKRSAQ